MNKKTTIRKVILAASLTLGMAAAVFAQDPNKAPPVPNATATNGSYYPSNSDGQLGSNYTEFDYSYVRHVSALPTTLNQYGITYNQAVLPSFDVTANYNWIGGSEAGIRGRQQEATVAGTYYLPQSWGRPFVSAEAGWIWQNFAGNDADAFTYRASTGVEFQVLPALVVTPYAAYQGTPSHFADNNFLWDYNDHVWTFGAKATYRLTKQWGLSLGAEIDEHHDLGYTGGVSFHF